MDLPPEPSPGTAAATPSIPQPAPMPQRLVACEAGLRRLQVVGECSAQFGMFVPCAAIVARLERCGAVPCEQAQRQMLSIAKRARYTQ